MDTLMANNQRMSQEILDDLSNQRFQNNVSREFDKQKNTGIVEGCISGDKVAVAPNSWRVNHSLGREPIGFILMAQGSTTSIVAKMTNMTATTADISFSEDPTSFTAFFY